VKYLKKLYFKNANDEIININTLYVNYVLLIRIKKGR